MEMYSHVNPPYFDIPDIYKRIYEETVFMCGIPVLNMSNTKGLGIAQTASTMFHTMRVVEYLCNNNIPGEFVECGVFRGASPIIMIKTIQYLNLPSRNIWLYDTFSGHPSDTPNWNPDDYYNMNCSLEEVNSRLSSLDYPHIKYIKGKVEDTLLITENRPEQVAFLRLDTDFYASTKAELEWLEPLVSPGGIIVIDDYGGFPDCKQAVDEYTGGKIFLHRIDEHVRTWVK